MNSTYQFQRIVWKYYKENKRAFPWREKAHFSDPYKVLVSEIMLQQTQASRVVGKYLDFLETFPTLETLAEATPRQVITAWQGLGYNRRALSLKRIAEDLVGGGNDGDKRKKDFFKSILSAGSTQKVVESLDSFPGIGHATASSIAAFAWNLPTIFIETNIRRVFIHHFFEGLPKVSDEAILKLVERTLPLPDTALGPRDWYYALMDYGSMLKTSVENPNRRSRGYQIQKSFKGSNREVRGAILSSLSAASLNRLTRSVLKKRLASRLNAQQISTIDSNCRTLEKEGFLAIEKGGTIRLT